VRLFSVVLFGVIAASLIPISSSSKIRISEFGAERTTVMPPFGLMKTPYNESYAVNMMYFSAAAYCKQWMIAGNWTCDACRMNSMFKLLGYVTGTNNTFGYVGVDLQRKLIVTAYKGTAPNDLEAWMNNLSIAKVPYPYGGQVHSGFWSAYQSVALQQQNLTRTALSLYPNYTVVFTGHSLGAALSALASVDVYMNVQRNNTMTTYLYGCPRIGDQTFSQAASGRMPTCYRVVHHKDPVVHLPQQELGFWHFPYEVYYGVNQEAMIPGAGGWKVCDSTGEDSTCADSLNFPTDVNDHLYYFQTRVGTDCATTLKQFASMW